VRIRTGPAAPLVLALLLGASILHSWVARFHPDSGDVGTPDVTADTAGNVYVCASVPGSGGSDYLVVKYDPDGNEQWFRTWDGPVQGEDVPSSVAADGLGRVYVTGRTGTSAGAAFGTVCFSPSGESLWAGIHDTLFAGDDAAVAVVPAGSGDCYVVGTATAGSGRGKDIAVVFYDSLGTAEWAQLYNGPGRTLDSATCAALDDSGSVIVAGASAGRNDTLDYVLLRYSPEGQLTWFDRRRADSTAIPRALHIDHSGGINVTGSAYFGPGTGWDAFTAKYNANRSLRWTMRYNGPGSTNDHGMSLDTDLDTNLYVAVLSHDNDTHLDVVGHYPDGQRIGTTALPLAGDSTWLHAGIFALRLGGFAVTVPSRDTSGQWDYLFQGFDRDFEPTWTSYYDGFGLDDLTTGHSKVSSQDLCVTGRSLNPSGSWGAATIVLPIAGPGIAGQPRRELAVLRASPNPARMRLAVSLPDACSRGARLQLVDRAGRTAFSQDVSGSSGKATMSLSGLAPGVYFLRLEPGPAAPTAIVVLD
jgi:hypothetical protein